MLECGGPPGFAWYRSLLIVGCLIEGCCTATLTRTEVGIDHRGSLVRSERKPEAFLRFRGKHCSRNRENVIKDFVPSSASDADAEVARDKCEEFCNTQEKCWGCSIYCGHPCQWNAIPSCGNFKSWTGKIDGDIIEKPAFSRFDRKKGKQCSLKELNIIQSFAPTAKTDAAFKVARDSCEVMCQMDPMCWGCSVSCRTNHHANLVDHIMAKDVHCNWNAIPDCGVLIKFPGLIDGDVVYKHGNPAIEKGEADKFAITFWTTGCPNGAPYEKEWRAMAYGLGERRNTSYLDVLQDMWNVCKANQDGKATKADADQCCGSGGTCYPTCELQDGWTYEEFSVQDRVDRVVDHSVETELMPLNNVVNSTIESFMNDTVLVNENVTIRQVMTEMAYHQASGQNEDELNVTLTEEEPTIGEIEECRKNAVPITGADQCVNIEGGQWQLVRHVPACNLQWHNATDHLMGDDWYDANHEERTRHRIFKKEEHMAATKEAAHVYNGDEAWSIDFSTIRFDQFLFSTVDCAMWMVVSRSGATGGQKFNQPGPILLSSEHPSHPSNARWQMRQGVIGDPIISLTDHDRAMQDGKILYAEGNMNFKGGTAEVARKHGGFNVYIREQPFYG